MKTGSRGRPCLLSYNSVKLALPQGDIRRESIGFTRGPGVRWHEVRGHWRELTLGEQKVMRYIWAFHRGNARLGVVLKTRNVTAKRLKHDLPPPELAA